MLFSLHLHSSGMRRAIRKHEEDICKLFLNTVADLPGITVHGVTDLEQVHSPNSAKLRVGWSADAYFLPDNDRRKWTSACSAAC